MICQSALKSARIRAAIPIALLLLLAACQPIPPARSAAPASAESTSPLAPTALPAAPTALPAATEPAAQLASGSVGAELANGTYDLPDVGSFQLKNGKFEQQTGAGATQVRDAGLEGSASGDLNGDGKQDAVAEVWVNTGGTGVFHYLVALLNKDGKLRQTASTVLGDRVRLGPVTVDPDGSIVAGLTGFKASDPLCCPSQAMTRTYQLEGGALKMLSEVTPAPTP